jgi:aminopeptidase-like protein
MRSNFTAISSSDAGERMTRLISDLYPICRSITGDGVRETFRIINEFIPLKISEVPSGTSVFDWTVPKEWNIRDAYIKDSNNQRIVDFRKSNLHVLNYSIPVDKEITLDELKKHLFTIPEHENWIPYRTSYYNETWGFCMNHQQYKQLKDGVYRVFIDSTLENGHLSHAECFIFISCGYDERQYCSPGFDLPVRCLMRTLKVNPPSIILLRIIWILFAKPIFLNLL